MRCLRALFRRAEAIADAADRFDEGAGFSELLAKALDVRVDGSGFDVEVQSPYVVEQRFARLYAIAALHERSQQAKLECRQQNLAPLDVHAVRFRVDGELPELHDFG